MGSLTIEVPNQNYIVAVSGGVDSVVLLYLLTTTINFPKTNLVIAHVDHNIRSDSAADADFVGLLAKQHGLKFESIKLGGGTSDEASLRRARYDFLSALAKKNHAKVMTAHHQDDLIETAILNIRRGTGPFGLVALMRNPQVERPLLHATKKDILQFAEQNHLAWREDSTNRDQTYQRNLVRHTVVKDLGRRRADLIELIHNTNKVADELTSLIADNLGWVSNENGEIIRHKTSWYGFNELCYLMRHKLITIGIEEPTRAMIETAVMALKTLPPGKKINLGGRHWLVSGKTTVRICSR